MHDSDLLIDELEILLGISKTFMTYCLFNSEWIKPQKVMPSNLSISDEKSAMIPEKKGGKVCPLNHIFY